MSESETLAMARLARELRSQGRQVLNLSLGEPNFDVPDVIKKAAMQAIINNFSHYTPVPGYPELLEAVCEKLERDNGLTYSPSQIVCTTGAKQAIANAVYALVNPGDEVLLPVPYWVSYREMVNFAGGKCILVPSTADEGFKPSAEKIKSYITSRTKLLIFSSPCNPSGAVWNQQELAEWASVLEKYPGIYIISDEIYEHINYGVKPVSLAQFPAIKDRVIVVNGLSKGFAMTGWRFGYSASHFELASAFVKIMGQYTSATCSITQRAAIAALKANPEELVGPMVKTFAFRRQLIVELLKNEIPELKFIIPEGAFYIFADASFYFGKITPQGKIIHDSQDLCMYLLYEAGVALTPGTAFGISDHIRFSFAATERDIELSIKLVASALSALQ